MTDAEIEEIKFVIARLQALITPKEPETLAAIVKAQIAAKDEMLRLKRKLEHAATNRKIWVVVKRPEYAERDCEMCSGTARVAFPPEFKTDSLHFVCPLCKSGKIKTQISNEWAVVERKLTGGVQEDSWGGTPQGFYVAPTERDSLDLFRLGEFYETEALAREALNAKRGAP